MLVTWGGLVATASGKLGGMVASRNGAGPYLRTHAIPVDPGSTRQQAVRFALAQLTTRWVETLDSDQRASWETYAAAVMLPNPLGAMRNIGGIAMYVRCNSPRLSFPASTLDVIDDAPMIFDIGTYTEPVIGLVDEEFQHCSWGFTNTDDWAIAVGGAMFVYASRPQNESVNFFKGPYRPLGILEGAVVPPTSPVELDLPFPVEEGHKVFFRANVSLPDGRLASTFRGSAIVAS